jgi:ATP-dependent exoDNAse (exonuclease V) beta subunit
MITTGAHWYTLDGKPCHTQPTKKGAKKPERPTNITDAKLLRLLPSVSAITGMLDAPGLDYHKRKRVAEEACDCPMSSFEDREEYIKHLLKKADEPMQRAREFGSALHAPLETYYGQNKAISAEDRLKLPDGREVGLFSILQPAIKAVDDMGLQIQSTERILVSALGYAGTADMLAAKDGLPIIGDYKSKTTKEDEPIVVPFTYEMQIAAYWKAAFPLSGAPMSGFNLFISSTEPGRVEVHHYTNEQLTRAWDAFRCCLELWKIVNEYRSEF